MMKILITVAIAAVPYLGPGQTAQVGMGISGVAQYDDRGQKVIESRDGKVWVLRCDWKLHAVGTLDPKYLGQEHMWEHVIFSKDATQEDRDVVEKQIFYEANERAMAKAHAFWPGLTPPTKDCYAP